MGLDSATVGRNRWQPFNINYDRTILDIKGNTVIIDAPIFCAIETRWGGGELIKYTEERIEQVRIENLRGVSEYNPSVRQKTYGNTDRDKLDPKYQYQGDEYFSDENHYFNFINISNAKNVWVRNMSALHFGSSVVQVNAGSKWVTVQDCESSPHSCFFFFQICTWPAKKIQRIATKIANFSTMHYVGWDAYHII